VAGGKALKEAGYSFDVAHTSLLTRAQVDTVPFHYGTLELLKFKVRLVPFLMV
jgi:hypothetical protein